MNILEYLNQDKEVCHNFLDCKDCINHSKNVSKHHTHCNIIFNERKQREYKLLKFKKV